MVGGTGERREGGEQGCTADVEEDSVPVHMGTSFSLSLLSTPKNSS